MKKKFILHILITITLTIFILPAQQRGFKVVVKTSEGSTLGLYRQYRALVIGVSDYLYWPRLPNAVKDAREVASVLKDRGFLVTILENPISDKIKKALKRLVFQESSAEDGVLIYFAGHGDTMRLADGTELGYIVPRDCPLQKNDPIGFTEKAINMEEIQTYSLQLKAKHLLAVFDSCFSGSIFALGRAAPADITFKTAQPVRQYITAGSGDEIVPDESIFKKCFLDALKGEADANSDGYVTGSELGLYLESNVVNYSRNAQHPQYGKIRNPNLDKGDFVFVLDRATIMAGKVQLPPKPPKQSDLDLSSIKKSAEKRAKLKSEWQIWQEKMQSGFEEIGKIDKNANYTSQEKIEAWQKFLNIYNANDPFSSEDEYLRKKAKNRIEYWNSYSKMSNREKEDIYKWPKDWRKGYKELESLEKKNDFSLRSLNKAWTEFLESYNQENSLIRSIKEKAEIYKKENTFLKQKIISNSPKIETKSISFHINNHLVSLKIRFLKLTEKMTVNRISFDMRIPHNIYGVSSLGGWFVPWKNPRGESNSLSWMNFVQGDVIMTHIDPWDFNRIYFVKKFGHLYSYNKKSNSYRIIIPLHSEVRHRFDSKTPFVLDPFEDATYTGSQFLHRSWNKGAIWEIISPDLTTNNPKRKEIATISCIAPSPVQKGIVWVGTNDGNVQLTKDGGKSWARVVPRNLPYKKKNLPKNISISHIEVSRWDGAIAWAVTQMQTNIKNQSFVFYTKNFGEKWKKLNLKDVSCRINILRQDMYKKNLLILGTDVGVFISIDYGNKWYYLKDIVPEIPVNDIKIHPRDHSLIIATSGCGIIVINDIQPLRNLK